MLSSDYSPKDQNKAQYYQQFGLAPGAPMRDVEAAYWKLARELKGQSAMAAYNAAYEALVSRSPAPIATPDGAPPTEAPTAAKPVTVTQPERPPSKFNWPPV